MNACRKREWFDDDAFWQELYPFMFPASRFAEAAGEVEKLLALAAPAGRSALDLCCGPGRISMELAEAGFKVTGIDRTRFLLDKAEAAAKQARVSIEWVESDMRDFVRNERYDLVVNLFTSFGYFDNKDDDRLVLRNMFTNLKPGGICVIDLMGKERLAKILQPTTSEELADGSRLVQRHEIFDNWTRIRNEWILIRRGRARSFTFHHTVYSGQELTDRLAAAGFRDIRLYGTWSGDPYGPDAQRLIAICRKPEPAETAEPAH